MRKEQGILNHNQENSPVNRNSVIEQMLELTDRDFKEIIKRMFKKMK